MLETLLKHLKEQKDLGLTNDILMETLLNLKSTFFGMYSFLLTF